jgi:hypothetical protein
VAGTFTVRVEGLRELDAKLATLGPALGPATLSLALARAAQPTVELAKGLVPYDSTREKGKHLRDTIVATTRVKGTQRTFVDPASAHAFVGPAGKGSQHGHLVEFGHKLVAGRVTRVKRSFGGKLKSIVKSDTRRVVGFVPPHPFLAPAWTGTRDEVLRNFSRDVWLTCVAVARGAKDAAASGTIDSRALDASPGEE